ncbi:PTS system mannose-specific IIC component [Mobilisporobacter senegalensis]|uniref:PTS system mannose-specific IIC component n=1 Tax=Mobilisporobacter senegalensis TaxID=1329262 RepID=A0A3N1X5V0_9FIRM|nr:PTS sugar transporter subunit IIC [Mobilisporobacter senegalensis]ROR22166.1 PTS system mannose-specific IIC component [Mobilisporobacter senegalensis]
MEIGVFQAILIGVLSYLGSLSCPWLLGLTGGWYTISRPLISGFLIGLVLGDVTTGIIVGVAVQVVFIALVTPGGQMPQDLNSAAYIGVTLGILMVKRGGTVESAVSVATAVGAIGTIFHNFMMFTNTFWNAAATQAIKKGNYKGLFLNHWVLPQIVQACYRIIPTFVVLYLGQSYAGDIIAMFPVDSFIMRALTALGGMLPAVGVAILLKQVTKKDIDIIRFLLGFALVAALGMNMITLAIIGAYFAYNHFVYTAQSIPAVAAGGMGDDLEEEL